MSKLQQLAALVGVRAQPSFIQFIKFCSVGVLNTLTTLSLYVLLTRTTDFFYTHYVGAEAVAYFAGTIVSFTLNRHWTFTQTSAVSFFEVVRFYSALLSGLVINVSIVYAFVEWLRIYDILAVALSLGATAAWNFLLMKFWVFTGDVKRVK